MIDIVMPTLLKPHHRRSIRALEENTRVPFRLHLVTEGRRWSEAVNIGFKECTNDIVIMDDDVEVLPGWDNGLDKLVSHADLIGFKLLFPNGRIQHAGGMVTHNLLKAIASSPSFSIGHRGYWQKDRGQFSQAIAVPFVTFGLVYIKRSVVDTLGGIDESYAEGLQYEDVDFNFRALANGSTTLYCPNAAIHHESTTQKEFANFAKKSAINYAKFHKRWFEDEEFVQTLATNGFISHSLGFASALPEFTNSIKRKGFRGTFGPVISNVMNRWN